jgi:penicillin G amidase
MDDNQCETIQVPGLSAAAEIRIDTWGIAHIRAASEADLFFVQGFNAARDRLWQIDLWRKRGLGLLAADFGPGYLAQDYAARHFLFRGDMDAEWSAYGSEAKRICEAFTAGINAYVTLLTDEPQRMPPEFTVFGTQPALWHSEDVVRIRSHALARNAVSEVLRANVLALSDHKTDLLRSNLEPLITPHVNEGIRLETIPISSLDIFKLATAPVTFEPDRLNATLDDVWKWTKVTELGDVVQATADEGSNNWVVSGERTSSGRPIVASDPHRSHALPSLRYLVHLTAPGLDVIGAGEPSVPGISIGHNGTVAFGLTIFGADQEDVYVYETKEGEPDRYRYSDDWRSFEKVDEEFIIRGFDPLRLTLSFSLHGPVLYQDPKTRTAIALRSVWAAPGAAPYLGSLTAMRARTVAEYDSALAAWGTPSANHVCADVSGSIGKFSSGFTPVRTNWDGLLPIPGDGRFEWQGFIPHFQLPHSINPPDGFIATANEMNIPADWPSDGPVIGYEWVDASRAKRIKTVLSKDQAHTIAGSQSLQTDVFSLPATRVCGLLARLNATDLAGRRGQALLTSWDSYLSARSPAAALYEVWWTRHLKTTLLTRLVPGEKLRILLLPGSTETLISLLENPDARFGSDPELGRDEMLLESLASAVAECEALMGHDTAAWRWGKLHHAHFHHAASKVMPDTTGSWNVGPFELGGSSATPMNAGYRISDFRVITGASVRLVMDVGEWDNSTCINTPGQSGDPRSPHFGNLAPLWADGDYVPLLYCRTRVDAATERVVQLLPPSALS